MSLPAADVEHEANEPISVPVDLREDAVLWAINRQVFHPHGFALGVDLDTGELRLYGNGGEVYVYGSDVEEDELFARFQALLQRAREQNE